MKTPDSRLVDIFLELARIDGVSGRERDINRYVRYFLETLNIPVSEDDAGKYANGNSGNLLCQIGSGGDFVLLAHMDTARSTNGVQPIIGKDRITSDGTTVLGVDNRAGIALILYNLEKALQKNITLKDFTIAFTICEETTGIGSRHLQLNGHIRKGFVLDSSLRPGNFINRSYGARSFRIKINGKPSHSGIAPEKGVNAILAAAKAISQIPLGRISDTTTANVGIFNGGSAVNVVPGEAHIFGEVRSLDKDDLEKTLKQIEETFTRSAAELGATIEFSSEWDFVPYEIKPDADVFEDLTGVLRKVGFEPQTVTSPGGSDANSLNANGIPAVNIGIGAQNPHGNDEFILLEDLAAASEITLELMKK